MTSEYDQRIVIENADYVVTMDPDAESGAQVLERASVAIVGNQIEQVGQVDIRSGDDVYSGLGRIVLPGLINTHHHTFQALLKGHPKLQNQPIGNWITTVGGVTAEMDENDVRNAQLVNDAELLLGGCTTTADMPYIFPSGRGDLFGAAVQAAHDIGIRYHPYRGSMSLSQKDGAIFPDRVVQDTDTILEETEEAINRHFAPGDYAMTRVGIAPCNIFTSSPEDYRQAALLADAYLVNLQTHLAESRAEVAYSLEQFGGRPLNLLRNLGWVGNRVSFVHSIVVEQDEIERIVDDKSSIVHCPISNARAPLGENGLAPITRMLEAGVNVALGTDGSAGNDSSNMREELRWARILPGTVPGSTYLDPMQVLAMATTNAATLLNWPQLGSLAPGQAADVAVFKRNTIETAGSWDPVTAFVSTQATLAEMVIVNGRVVVEGGVLKTMDQDQIIHDTVRSLAKLREKN